RLAHRGHYAAAALLAETAVRCAMADLAVTVRPDHKRFYSAKRLQAFLQSERAIDRALAESIRRLAFRAADVTFRGADDRPTVLALVSDAAELRDRLQRTAC
ncbi:MAG TPA: hypothetical protein PJ982_17450, partial [Lacipirellulaceae bacterium]|nr:hypothetical protein [Lacipirellulaceae bacterium]